MLRKTFKDAPTYCLNCFQAWIVERMGKFHRILDPGLNILIPIMDRVKYVQSLKEIAIDVPKQSAITSDNVTINIDGVLYLRIVDPYLASYGVEDPEFAITQLAQTTMRSELGKISLDKVFRERENLNVSIVDSINKASEAWGITCLRYEIRKLYFKIFYKEDCYINNIFTKARLFCLAKTKLEKRFFVVVLFCRRGLIICCGFDHYNILSYLYRR